MRLQIQIRQEVWLRKHTTIAIKENVRVPAGTLGLVVRVQEHDTAIVEVVDLGQVELRVQDLIHVSLVINQAMIHVSLVIKGGGVTLCGLFVFLSESTRIRRFTVVLVNRDFQ
jgi:hypothetical protein